MLVEVWIAHSCGITPFYRPTFCGCGISGSALACSTSMTITLRCRGGCRDCFGFGRLYINPLRFGFVSWMNHENR